MSLTRSNPYQSAASCVDSFDEDSAESSRSIAALFQRSNLPPPIPATEDSSHSISDSASESSSSDDEEMQTTITFRVM